MRKTAVICSCFWSDYIWLATGGKSQLNNKLQVLKGRKIVAFPDVDGYQEWKEKLSQLRELDIMISDILEKSATAEDRNNHVDIADLLIRQYRKEHISITPVGEERGPINNPVFLKMKEFVKLDNENELAFLIDDLGLEMVGYKRI